jgi:hypothetical protein
MKLFEFFHAEDFDVPKGGWATNEEERVAQVIRQNRVLKSNLERSLLISQALWEIVRFQSGLSDEDILQKFGEIDLRDGMLDGRKHGSARTCTGCGQHISTRNAACPYCGHVMDTGAFNAD